MARFGEAQWFRSVLAAARLDSVSAGLAGLAILSAAVRIVLVSQVHGPFLFSDELGYEQMAKSFGTTGHFALFNKPGLAYSPLYPIVLSPIYALTSPHAAYEWVKVVNAVLMSLSVFPVYAIARFVLSRRHSMGVAALAVIAPLMSYTSLELSENLAYPLFLVAVWRLLCALREPRPRNDALFMGAVVLASAARLQAVVLVPAALTAIALCATRAALADRRWAYSFRQMLVRHRLLLATVVVGLVAVVVRMIQNGGAIPFAGRYAVVGQARPAFADVVKIVLHHLAGLDLLLGVVPFACALTAAYALARSGFRSRAFMWAAVATATTFWVLLEVGIDAAAFDTGHRLPGGAYVGDPPRIHERYLIYIVPFFLVALVAVVRRGRPRLPRKAYVLIAATAAILPVVIPYTQDINRTSVADSPSLQILGTVKHGVVAPIDHPTAAALVIAALLAAVYLFAFLEAGPPLALLVTVLGFAAISLVAMGRITSAARGATSANLPANADWVDRAGVHDVALIGGIGARRLPALETAFNNGSISQLYYLCRNSIGSDFGEIPLRVGSRGRLLAGSSALRARFVVAPAFLDIRGRLVARNRRGHLELVAPSNGVVVVARASRDRLSCGT